MCSAEFESAAFFGEWEKESEKKWRIVISINWEIYVNIREKKFVLRSNYSCLLLFSF